MIWTALTLTQDGRQTLLSECTESIQQTKAVHIITNCTGNYALDRIRSIEKVRTDFFAFVDDDDTLESDCDQIISAALKQHSDKGVIISDENIMSADGKTKKHFSVRKSYLSAAMSPRNMHHLCLMRVDAIDIDGALEIHSEFGIGIDWCLKASAALRAKAIHVPRPLYNWRNTPNNMTSKDSHRFLQSMGEIGNRIMQRWPVPRAEVEVYHI